MTSTDDSTNKLPTPTVRDVIRLGIAKNAPYRRTLLIAWASVVLAVMLGDVAAPLIFATILGRVAHLNSASQLWPTFGKLLILYALVTAAQLTFWRLAGWFEWDSSLKSFIKVINDGFAHLMSLSYRWHADHAAGESEGALVTFSWAYTETIDAITWQVLRTVLMITSVIVVLAVVIWPVALVMVAFMAAFVLVIAKRMRPVHAAGNEFTATHARATGMIADVLGNVTTVKSQGTDQREADRLAEMLAESLRADFTARSRFSALRWRMEAVLSVLSWAAMFVGVVLAIRHDVGAAVVYLVLFYTAQVATSMQQSFDTVREIQRDLAKCTPFTAIMAVVPEVQDAPGSKELKVPSGRVDFSNVSFRYRPDRPLFDGLDLSIKPGEHVGIVGASGGGKSTLGRLILRFMDVDDGTITVDGTDIARVTQASLRQHISYVPQDPQLLHRSVAENIWYGRDDEIDTDVLDAIGRAAHVHEFASQLPDGYDTLVGDRGVKLSGGQRQRVAIAQAMAKNAPILIMDEATSALDSESEKLVQDALWRLMERSTSLVIAHRLSTIAHMDRILVLEGGTIVEQGSHRELLAKGGLGPYGRLWQHQSGGFLVDPDE
jgi:ATP-binding cassette subfamily B protein